MSAQSPKRKEPSGRAAFARFVPVSTRWSDNDVYGHLNNAAYYGLFDSAANALLIEAGLLDPLKSPVIGVVAESDCTFFSSLGFPDAIEIGVAVERLGRSSIRYRFGAFLKGAERASAEGGYTHVYVVRATGRPAEIPAAHRELMESLYMP